MKNYWISYCELRHHLTYHYYQIPRDMWRYHMVFVKTVAWEAAKGNKDFTFKKSDVMLIQRLSKKHYEILKGFYFLDEFLNRWKCIGTFGYLMTFPLDSVMSRLEFSLWENRAEVIAEETFNVTYNRLSRMCRAFRPYFKCSDDANECFCYQLAKDL